tara:strand:- start:1682 stop:2602 length:921 start_codon:yes stop_codon:yes gene_type:complete
MGLFFQNLYEIKGGLSKKKVFRKKEKNYNKIIIDFSRDKKEFHDFLNVYNILLKINIAIPRIYEVHLNKHFIIMEDFGDNTYDKVIKKKEIYNLLKLAVDSLIIIQNSITSYDLCHLEKYKFNNLMKEISEFVDYYLPYKKINNFDKSHFFEIWEKNYNSQNFDFNYFAHKDFELINIFLLQNNNSKLKCGIIDFQSAFRGFAGWDLFSLLENSRINFTSQYNEEFIKYFYENISFQSDFTSFRDQYYILNLARQTRLLGRWVKISYQGNKNYLDYIYSTKSRLISSLVNIKDENLKKIYEEVLSI